MMHCNAGHDTKEARLLPGNSDFNEPDVYLCHAHYEEEREHRQRENTAVPPWETLKPEKAANHDMEIHMPLLHPKRTEDDIQQRHEDGVYLHLVLDIWQIFASRGCDVAETMSALSRLVSVVAGQCGVPPQKLCIDMITAVSMLQHQGFSQIINLEGDDNEIQ